jgi:hypothetical protein
MPVLIKIALSAIAVGLLNVIAQRNSALGGWLTAFPIIGFLSVMWLLVDRRPAHDQSSFLLTMAVGLIPTTLVLLGVGLLVRAGMPLLAALTIGGIAWGAITFAVRTTGLLDA